MSKINCTLTLCLLILLLSDHILHTSCFEWYTWGGAKAKESKDENIKSDDYVNPWLFDTGEKEPAKASEPVAPEINVAQNQTQVNNNFGQQSGQINNHGVHNNYHQSAGQWPQGPQLGYLPHQPPVGNNFGLPNNNFIAPPQPIVGNNFGLANNNFNTPPQPQAQVKDLFMEPVNNQKPAAEGLNSWLSGDYDIPAWAKNPPAKNINEPPRKTKWDIEDEDNRKKAQLLQKFGKDAPPAYAHNFNNNYKHMLDKGALDSKGNLLYATQKEISSARRGSGYQTREEMIREGAFQEVPKNYYEGKILPMEETKAIISYTDRKLNELKRPNRKTDKDPPKEITGKNWLENIMGDANITKSTMLAITTELTFLLVAYYVMV